MEIGTKLNLAILKFLTEFEKRHNINLIFVCETSIRPQQVYVDDSDFDLKGLFLPNPEDCLKIMPRKSTHYQIFHNKIIIDSKEYNVDVNFYDFKEFSRQKLNS